MANSYFDSGVGARLVRMGAVAVGVALGATLLLDLAAPEGAFAQDKKAAPKSNWVKVCNSRELKGKDKAGKDVTKKIDICETLTQQIHPDSGIVMVGTTLQQVKMDGEERRTLILNVPPGRALPPGAAITVFPKKLWDKVVQKKEKLAEAERTSLKANTVKLVYTFCRRMTCYAEAQATPEVVKLLQSGAGFMVQTVLMSGAPVVQPVSLGGFGQALKNPPTDTKKFMAARAELAKQIRENQQKIIAEYRKKQEALNKMQPNKK